MNSATVIAPRLETLVSVNTSDNSKLNNLTFDGITFEYSTWNYPSENGLVELQAGMYANYCIFGTNDCTLALEFNAPKGKSVYIDNVKIELIN